MLNPGSAHLVLASLAGGPKFGMSALMIGSGGTGYTAGDVLALSGGSTAGLAASATVTTVSGGVITGITTNNPGDYTILPACIPTANLSLLHFDGANGATTTTDDNTGNTVTIATGSQLSTTQTKFGTASLQMDALTNPGTSNRGVMITGITSFGTGGWTMECWWYNPGGIITWRPIFASNASTYMAVGYGVQLIWSSVGTNLSFYASSNGASWNIADAVTIAGVAFNAGWNHVALVFDAAAGHYYSYVNGVKQHDVTSANTICGITNIWVVPSDYNGSELTLTAWIDEWALSSGCRYPNGTTFTPPTSAFTHNTCGTSTTGGTGTGAIIFPTWAPLKPTTLDRITKSTYINLSNGNLTAACSDPTAVQTFHSILASLSKTVGGTEKLYCEATYQGGVNFYVGLAQSGFSTGSDTFVGANATDYSFSSSGFKWNNNVSTAYGSQLLTPTTIGMEFDLNTGNVVFTVNGVSQGTAFTGLSGTYFPALTELDGVTATMNFGASAWAYSPPAGYVGWF